MATPAGHYLLGLAVATLASPDERARRRAPWWALLACVPDLDVLPGLLLGDTALFHRGGSHSLAAAGLAAVAATALVALSGRAAVPFWFPVTIFAVYASHLALDTVTADTSPPVGIPLLWPATAEPFQAPWILLPKVQHGAEPMVSLHNALLVARETLIFGPLVVLSLAARRSLPVGNQRAAWLSGLAFATAAGLSIASLS